MKKLFFFSIVFMSLFISCKKDEIEPIDTITPAMARDSLYYIMKDFYLWYDMPEAASVTTSNKSNYKDPYELLEAMRYKIVDKWSFIADYDEYMAEMQGTFVGHGIRVGERFRKCPYLFNISKFSTLLKWCSQRMDHEKKSTIPRSLRFL